MKYGCLASPKLAGLVLALVISSAPCRAGEAVNLLLNWTPTADHSPFYYAKAQGWYEKAGIDLTIETGKGSGVSSLKVGSGGSLAPRVLSLCVNREAGPDHPFDTADLISTRLELADEGLGGGRLAAFFQSDERNDYHAHLVRESRTAGTARF